MTKTTIKVAYFGSEANWKKASAKRLEISSAGFNYEVQIKHSTDARRVFVVPTLAYEIQVMNFGELSQYSAQGWARNNPTVQHIIVDNLPGLHSALTQTVEDPAKVAAIDPNSETTWQDSVIATVTTTIRNDQEQQDKNNAAVLHQQKQDRKLAERPVESSNPVQIEANKSQSKVPTCGDRLMSFLSSYTPTMPTFSFPSISAVKSYLGYSKVATVDKDQKAARGWNPISAIWDRFCPPVSATTTPMTSRSSSFDSTLSDFIDVGPASPAVLPQSKRG